MGVGIKEGLCVISEKAPAKINLSLDVIRRREDGYHELEMVMTMIDLADRVDLYEERYPVIRVESSSGVVPSDSQNLAYQAASLLQERYRVSRGASIYIDKKIPVAAGLAGGSSDAAATLRGLNRLWELHLSLDELARIGEEIGSDVPFCIYGGTALAKGRGEVLTHLPAPPPCWVVLAKPAFSVSTKEVYGALRVDHITRRPDTDKLVQVIKAQNYEAMCRLMYNVLEEVTMKMYPEVGTYKRLITRFGADAVLMSGSGPTVFALVRQESRVRRLVSALRGFCRDVYAVRLLGHGLNLRENVQK
jgi:4-diphosphocytidyl-2-C-methyl-D-erythritol kinase